MGDTPPGICLMTWHYGTLGPRSHADPTGPQAWSGIHGAPTSNASGFCTECEQDWRENYPRHGLPQPEIPDWLHAEVITHADVVVPSPPAKDVPASQIRDA